MKDIIRGNRERSVLIEEEVYRSYNYYITLTCMGTFCVYILVPESKVDEFIDKIYDILGIDDVFDEVDNLELEEINGMKYLGRAFSIPDYLPNNDLIKDYFIMSENVKAEYMYNQHILQQYHCAKANNSQCMYGSRGSMTQDKCREICKQVIDKIVE